MKNSMYIAMLLAFTCVVALAAQVTEEKTQQQNAKFLSVDITDKEPTKVSKPSANELIHGNPEFRSWTVESSDKGTSTGVWESTPGKWKFANSHWEYCRIISGVSIVTEVSGKTYTVKAGDSFVLKPGFSGTWEVLETTRKDFVAY
jgi:uncharacterized protein